MSLLIPTNLSGASSSKRKPDKIMTRVAHDNPSSFRVESGPVSNDRDEGNHPLETRLGSTDKETPRKTKAPVPVMLVTPDPLETMDQDEYGAELGKDARVWKVYVQESDQWDKELVEGWNKSLDVILVFAALFSAVSTTFLVESTGMLTRDPNDVSATALVAISQTLAAIARNSSVDPLVPTLPLFDTAKFSPPRNAIIVNTLWYLSLSLSIATSLLVMLAKDWCHSFMANRTGHPWDQTLRRQRKWVMIEQWKMQELITVLPSLIHLSLLLFAVGLCIYVWDINTTAAIPIICVSGVAFAFYVWSSIMASIWKLFPYTTIVSRTMQSDFLRRRRVMFMRYSKKCVAKVLSWISVGVKWLFMALLYVVFIIIALVCLPVLVLDILRLFLPAGSPGRLSRGEDLLWLKPAVTTIEIVWREARGDRVYQTIRSYFARAEAYIHSVRLIESNNDQDEMTSLALKWLIMNCETPGSVAIALQAIAGASSRIPRKPLESCHANLQILRRLVSSGLDNQAGSDARLYTRALAFLQGRSGTNQSKPERQDRQTTPSPERGQDTQKSEIIDMEVLVWDLKAEHERQVIDLINSTQIPPAPQNIQALTIGHSATSLGLRLLKGDSEDASRTFRSILRLYFDHIQLNKPKLAPAALQSLANAAVVLASCAQVPLLTGDLVRPCVEHCVSLFPFSIETTYTSTNKTPSPKNHPKNVLDPEIVFLICMLLHGCSDPQAAGERACPSGGTRSARAIHMLMDKHLRKTSFLSAFTHVGLLEILFNPGKYGTTWKIGDGVEGMLINFCKNYLDSGLLLSLTTLRGMKGSRETGNSGTEISAILDAIHWVYELMAPSKTLPPPIYCLLIWITCITHSNDQRTLCERLLSNTAFPCLDEFLVLSMNATLDRETFLSLLWRIYDRDGSVPTATRSPRSLPVIQQWGNESALFKARSRHFSATQLWLLLHLVGDTKSELQSELRDSIEDSTSLGTKTLGLKRVKKTLEDDLIQGYEQGYGLGTYSARIIECILEVRGTQVDEDLSRRISTESNLISPSLRGLSAFNVSMPSRVQIITTELPRLATRPPLSTPLSPSFPPMQVVLESEAEEAREPSQGNHLVIHIQTDVPPSEGA